jgi:hypothetical protein
LIAGIAQDARQLLIQQLTLFHMEVKNDISRAATGLTRMIAGGAVLLAVTILLGLALAHLLTSVVPDLPLWGALAIVGGAAAPIGAWLVWSGKAMFDRLPLSEQSLQALKENIEWKTKT